MGESRVCVEFQSVSKSFGDLSVFNDVSLAIREHEVTFIVGPSGCGKSVLTRMTVGLEHPDTGAVIVYGRDVTNLSERQLAAVRRTVAYVPQHPALFDTLTVAGNLALPLVANRIKNQTKATTCAMDLLSKFGLTGRADSMPSELNQSDKKIVSILRSLIMNPDCTILDEPTTGLDGPARAAVDSMIRTLGTGREMTIVVISHDMRATMSIADRIVFMYNGGIRLDGDRADFLRASTGFRTGVPATDADRGPDGIVDPVVAQFLSGSPQGPMVTVS